MIDLIAATLLRIVNLICYIIPTGWVLWFGRRVGVLIYWIGGYRYRIAYANLRAAFCKKDPPEEIKRKLKSLYKRLAETFAEVLCLTKVNRKYVDRYISIENTENFWVAANEGKGVIFLTAHFGNWELSAMVSALKGFPPYVLAREQKMKKLNGLINRLRESKGLKVITKGITTRYIVKALHEGKIIGMVADQDVGKNGMIADFFGRPVATADGPYRFAAKTGAVILPAFMVRLKGPYHRAVLEKPVKIRQGEDLLPYIEQYNRMLESYATKHYDQWLWFHRRWKSSPLKKIVILSDGKKGHLNQSLGLLDLYKKYREPKGYKDSDTDAKIIEIEFKSKARKTVLNFTSKFSSPRCQGCMKCLKWALTKSSYEKLASTYADVVISTGFSLAGVNSIYKYENNARNAVCMKPGLLGLKKFSMIVLPRHDVKKSIARKNVIITDTSPSLINDDYLKKSGESLRKQVKKESPNTMAVFFGGDNAGFRYRKYYFKKLFDEIKHAAESINADILFTTSRRTSPQAEGVIKDALGGEKRSKLLIVANEKNIPDAIGGMLALSDIVIVSGESASMVSEAVSSGRKVIVFKGEKKTNKPTKHEIFLDRLSDAGYLKITKPGELSGAIEKAFKDKASYRKPEDRDWVYRNMWRLGA